MPSKKETKRAILGMGVNTITDTFHGQAILVDLSTPAKATEAEKKENSSTKKEGENIIISVTVPMPTESKPQQPAQPQQPQQPQQPAQPNNLEKGSVELVQDKSKEADSGAKLVSSGPKKDESDGVAKPVLAKTYEIPSREVICNPYLIYSLNELKRKFDASLGIGVPSVGTQIKLDLSNIEQKSTQEIYYVLELKCIEKQQVLMAPYELDAPVKTLLAADDGNILERFSRKYGDSFVDSITYGRWATIIIQVKLSSREKQNEVSASLEQTLGTATIGGEFASSLQEKLQKQEYTAYLYSGGMDYVAMKIVTSVAAIDELVKKIMEDQKVSPVQIGWTTKPYEDVSKNEADKNAFDLEKVISVSRNIKELIEDASQLTKVYLQALNAEKIDPQIAKTVEEKSVKDYLKVVENFQTIKQQLDICNQKLKQYYLNEKEIILLAKEVNKLIADLNENIEDIPASILLPIKRVTSDVIQGIKHKNGEFNFYLDIPDDTSQYLHMELVGADGKPQPLDTAYKIKLKQFDPVQGKGKPLGVIRSVDKKTNAKSNKVPVAQDLSGLYFKPKKEKSSLKEIVELPGENSSVDIYVKFTPSLPSKEKTLTAVNFSELSDKFLFFPKISNKGKNISANLIGELSISGLLYLKVPGDGHCFFYAAGLYLGKDQQTLRKEIADYLRNNKKEFADVVSAVQGKKISSYIKDIEDGKEWADDLEISVLMRVLKRPIIVINSDGKIRKTAIAEDYKDGEPIFVCYNGHNHYDALLLRDGFSGKDVLKQLELSSEQVVESSSQSVLPSNSK